MSFASFAVPIKLPKCAPVSHFSAPNTAVFYFFNILARSHAK